MSDQEKPKGRAWSIVVLIGTIAFSGAAGAFINHYYATRQTIVNYSVNTTSLGAAEATKSVLPTLRLQLDNVEIPAVYTHTIELSHASGPELDQASVSITLPGARLYGNPVASGPDPVHQIACKIDQSTQSLVCSVGRITSGNNAYRVIVATDNAPKIAIGIDGKNAKIQESSIVGQQDTMVLPRSFGLISAVLAGVGAASILLSVKSLLAKRS